jgi:hypothetical protein
MPVITALGRMRREDLEFKVSLRYIAKKILNIVLRNLQSSGYYKPVLNNFLISLVLICNEKRTL